jgi:hypothetical protein
MTKRTHVCDESCTHPPKRTRAKNIPKKEITDIKIDEKEQIAAQSWLKTVNKTMESLSSTGNQFINEITDVHSSLIMSGNPDAIYEAQRIVDDCRRKLNNLKRDKGIT